jgi:hypothetical protein
MRILFSIAIFVSALIVATIACTWVGERFINNALYNCTDSVPLDFLHPDHWVHQPVAVQHVVVARSMSEPDTIKTGWSIRGLWLLWFSFVGASVIVSLLLARFPWSAGNERCWNAASTRSHSATRAYNRNQTHSHCTPSHKV